MPSKKKNQDQTPETQTPKKSGVIATIISLIDEAGEKGISKEALLEKLVEAFPEREAKAMKSTIGVQVPGRITKERFPLEAIKEEGQPTRYKRA